MATNSANSRKKAELPPNYTMAKETPTEEEYMHIRVISGLSTPPASAIATALKHSLYCVVVREADSGAIVGLSRVVGDGGLFAELVDVAVHPDHQKRGIGRAMLEVTVAWIDENCPNAYVSLIGAPHALKLYREFGWVDTRGVGMKRGVWGR